MTDTTKGEFLTIKQARELAGCDRTTIYRWFSAKKLTRYEVGPAKLPRVKRSELEALLTPRPVNT
jgi:excisionase family DNA binding protein